MTLFLVDIKQLRPILDNIQNPRLSLTGYIFPSMNAFFFNLWAVLSIPWFFVCFTKVIHLYTNKLRRNKKIKLRLNLHLSSAPNRLVSFPRNVYCSQFLVYPSLQFIVWDTHMYTCIILLLLHRRVLYYTWYYMLCLKLSPYVA